MTTENNTEIFQKDPNHSDRPNFCKLLTTKVVKYKTNIYESQRIDFKTKKRAEHLRARVENILNINPNERIISLPTSISTIRYLGYQRIQDLMEVIPQGNNDYSLLSILKSCKNI
jgi:hypothetical protein